MSTLSEITHVYVSYKSHTTQSAMLHVLQSPNYDLFARITLMYSSI